jgi:predicted phage terminase large subunit-like protein
MISKKTDYIKAYRNRLNHKKELSKKANQIKIEKSLQDFRYFVITYLPHYLKGNTKETSQFRNYIYNNDNKIEKNKINLIFAYRGSAKSTLFSKAKSLHKIVQKKTKYTIHISDGATLAKENLEAIRLELEENSELIEDFNIKKASTWAEDRFIVKVDNHYLKVQAFGSGTRIRGKNFLTHRPDNIFIDDLENDINIENKNQRDKLEQWFISTVLQLPNRDELYNIYILGTVLHYDSVLIRLSNRKDIVTHKFSAILKMPTNMVLWEKCFYSKEPKEFFVKNKKELLKGIKVDNSLWLESSSMTIFELLMFYFENKKAFYQELQMEGFDEENQLFKPLFYKELPSDLIYYFGIDPALGKKNGDYWAIVVIGKSNSSKKYYVVDAVLKKEHPDNLTIQLIKLAKTYNPIKISIETVQFQEYYKDSIKNKSFDLNIHLPVSEFKSSLDKEIRVSSIAPDVNDGTILFNPNLFLLIEQIEKFPKHKHDDGPDAVQIAYQGILKGASMSQIAKSFNKKIFKKNTYM